jgi:hypothetical protein
MKNLLKIIFEQKYLSNNLSVFDGFIVGFVVITMTISPSALWLIYFILMGGMISFLGSYWCNKNE